MSHTKKKPKAIVYVDGFNLYRRMIKGTNYKWLNLASLSDMMLMDFDVIKIKYFTAKVPSLIHDPNQSIRQAMYLRALRTEARIEIFENHFTKGPRKLPGLPWRFTKTGAPYLRKVFYAREKGSDVHLASHLIIDAFKKHADAYVVITNDSDQVKPLRMLLHEKIGIFGILVPSESPSKELTGIGLPVTKKIREGVLASSQFPDKLFDENGEISKPASW